MHHDSQPIMHPQCIVSRPSPVLRRYWTCLVSQFLDPSRIQMDCQSRSFCRICWVLQVYGKLYIDWILINNRSNHLYLAKWILSSVHGGFLKKNINVMWCEHVLWWVSDRHKFCMVVIFDKLYEMNGSDHQLITFVSGYSYSIAGHLTRLFTTSFDPYVNFILFSNDRIRFMHLIQLINF